MYPNVHQCVCVCVCVCVCACACVHACVHCINQILDFIHSLTVLQGSPNDAGLQGVINHPEIGVNWSDLAIALGVPTTKIDTSSRPVGLSAFQHWRNGKVEGAQTTWEFLLKRVTEQIGPEVTKKLKEDIFSHPHWTE